MRSVDRNIALTVEQLIACESIAQLFVLFVDANPGAPIAVRLRGDTQEFSGPCKLLNQHLALITDRSEELMQQIYFSPADVLWFMLTMKKETSSKGALTDAELEELMKSP